MSKGFKLSGRTQVGTFEWQTILAFMGASEAEIKDVQLRMGRVWR